MIVQSSLLVPLGIWWSDVHPLQLTTWAHIRFLRMPMRKTLSEKYQTLHIEGILHLAYPTSGFHQAGPRAETAIMG